MTDFSLGAGGTLATHARNRLPPTLTVHVPQSPFLQLVGTFKPSLRHASISFEPSATSMRLPFALNGVFAYKVVARGLGGTWKA